MSRERFVENINSYGLGSLLDELADEQGKIVSAVMQTAKKGKLVLELNYKRRGNNEIEVSANVKPTIPRVGLDSNAMFVKTGDTELHDENPDQMTVDDAISFDRDKKKVNQV